MGSIFAIFDQSRVRDGKGSDEVVANRQTSKRQEHTTVAQALLQNEASLTCRILHSLLLAIDAA
jgi:hypothetical protein